jgi:hypothetical protein
VYALGLTTQMAIGAASSQPTSSIGRILILKWASANLLFAKN